MTAEMIARALGGHRAGDGYLVRCPVRGHGRGKGDRSPSLMLRDGDRRLLVHCFCGCDSRDVLAALQQGGLLDREVRDRPRTTSAPTNSVPTPGSSTAHRLWKSALPIEGTLAERYLAEHRGLVAPFPRSLRFAPDCLHPRFQWCFPALVAGVQAPDGRVTAVQLTWLSREDGSKALSQVPRWTFGALGDGAVRLGPAEKVLGLAEGIEDALAASQLSQVSQVSQLSCWACLGAARMHRVRIPEGVRELHIFADDDQAGRAAAERTARMHRDAGRRVLVRLPPAGLKDWGELVQLASRRTAA